MPLGPSVISVMTPFPAHAEADTSIIAAQAMMMGHDVRHLPVQRDGRVIGVVNESDLRTATTLTANPEMPIGRLCTRPPVVVHHDAALRDALLAMSDEGVDAAVVLRNGRLAGILTLSDICGELLRRLPAPFVEEPDGVA
jgi:acetoin utilization protein AcuB